MSRRRSFACAVVLMAVACGEPTAPPDVTSEAFDVTASLSSRTISRSSPSDSLVVYITVRNPLPVRATVRQPMPNYSTHVWWTLDIVRDTTWGATGIGIEVNGWGELTLEPRQTTKHRIVLHARDFTSLPPAAYRVNAGILHNNVFAGDLVVAP